MENTFGNFQKANTNIKIQILDQIPTIVMTVDRELRITYMNHAGQRLVNKKLEDILGQKCCNIWDSLHCNTSDCNMYKSIESGEMCSSRSEIAIGDLKKPIEYYSVPLKDEEDNIIGGLEFVIDITERAKYEERLKEQSQTIREMSTPTIELWDGVLVLPVVGVVDSMRAQHMMDSMLNKIAETHSKVIIMDIQGVAAVDTAVANHLIKITRATKLMGCECILSGITPAVAQTVIQLGINMDTIKTKSTLSDALAEAFKILNLEVKNKKE